MRISFAGWRAAAATVGLAGVALLAAGCGPTSGPSSAASPASPSSSSSAPGSSTASASASPAPADAAVCADTGALRVTLAKIPHALSGNSARTLTAELNTAKTELDNLANASGDQYRAQSGGLKAALTSLQAAISADAHGTGSIISVLAAAGHVTTQAHLLLAAAGDCPSASPTPPS